MAIVGSCQYKKISDVSPNGFIRNVSHSWSRLAKRRIFSCIDRNICKKEEDARRTMVKVPLSNSFLERRDARRKFSESLRAGASPAPRTHQRISLGSENDCKFRLRSCQSWKASSLSLGVRLRQTSNGWDMSDPEETIWDPISSLGRVVPPSDFVLDSCRSTFSQTKKNYPERLLPRPSTPQP